MPEAADDAQALPLHRSLYISAVLPASLTVSGPPSILQSFLDATPQITHVKLSLGAPFHAPHLPNPLNETLLGLQDNLQGFSEIANGDFYALLSEVTTNIFQKRLDLVATCTTIQQHHPHALTVIGPTGLMGALKTTLRSSAVSQYRPDDESCVTDANRIAIVGMSGRVPGAEDAEEFWDLLMAGKDMCEEVSCECRLSMPFDLTQFYSDPLRSV